MTRVMHAGDPAATASRHRSVGDDGCGSKYAGTTASCEQPSATAAADASVRRAAAWVDSRMARALLSVRLAERLFVTSGRAA
jgi:hypothetical protein